MTKLFIKENYLSELKSIFNSYCPKAEIWAYGSRVSGDAHEGSDLDLVVKNFGDNRCKLSELKARLGDSDIPFLIDVNEFDNLPITFQKEIEKKYIVIFCEK